MEEHILYRKLFVVLPCWVGCLKSFLSEKLIYGNNLCFSQIFTDIIFDRNEVIETNCDTAYSDKVLKHSS